MLLSTLNVSRAESAASAGFSASQLECRPEPELVDSARWEAGVLGIGSSEVGAETAGETGSRTVVVGDDTASSGDDGVIGTGRLHEPLRSPDSSLGPMLSHAESPDDELNPPARNPSVELCSPSRSPSERDGELNDDEYEVSSADGAIGAGRTGPSGTEDWISAEAAGSGGSGSEGSGTGSGVYSFATPDSGNDPVRLEGSGTVLGTAPAAGSTAACAPDDEAEPYEPA